MLLVKHMWRSGTIQPVYRNTTSYNGMSIATELGMAPTNSESSSGSLTGAQLRLACEDLASGSCLSLLVNCSMQQQQEAHIRMHQMFFNMTMAMTEAGQVQCPGQPLPASNLTNGMQMIACYEGSRISLPVPT